MLIIKCKKNTPISILILFGALNFLSNNARAFDDFDDHHQQNDTPAIREGPMPKDKVLLKDVKSLTFQRNKRTTSRRTHSIHQLSCVGGTAGCKLFTPDTVECLNVGYNHDRSKFDWKCHAEISERVMFNHVEVICEGYDYPEDDYILLGSCGLEFTLDYTDSRDFHHQSYFHHLDEHEKELHQQRSQPNVAGPVKGVRSLWSLWEQLPLNITNHMLLVGIFMLSYSLWRYVRIF